jgi:D-cysteine desulfhydrase
VSTRGAELHERWPELSKRLPRAPLCALPTPVTRAEKLEAELGCGPLYVKHDERSAALYGGNKPRKLEWILGAALARGRTRILTTGALGTNHGLATALYARSVGLRCELVLVPQPVTDAVRRRQAELRAAGATVFLARNVAHAAALVLLRLARHPRTVYLPTGGSNPTGVVGAIEAGLELAAQVRAGALPPPARVYVALGSGGTAAGLAAGFALAGLSARTVAVLVTDIVPPSHAKLVRLARAALRCLARAGAELDPDALAGTASGALEVERAHVGPGYGHATAEASTMAALALERAGVELDPTYTAKALAALASRERGSREATVFWNTFAGTAH